MRAIIGCSHCSKELATYILTREDISKAIYVYHRVKDYIKVENGEVLPKKKMSKFRIKLNDYAGRCFYFLIAGLGLLPIFLYMVLNLLGNKIDVGFDFFISAFFSALMALLIGFHILNLSYKPFLTDVFCNYKKYASESKSNVEESEESKAA